MRVTGSWPDPADRALHGSSFGTQAAAYAEHRPDYAEAAVRWALEPVLGREPLRVLDLGAGTGKLTGTLAALAAAVPALQVVAVEPDPAMRAELCRLLPEVDARSGSAEHIPLSAASADAVLAGQAAHWFDMERAVPEIARVLAPGGIFAGLWNIDDDRVGWVAGLTEACGAIGTLSRWRTGRAGPTLEMLQRFAQALFGPAEVAEFAHSQRRTADSLVATIATHSDQLVMSVSERNQVLARVRGYLRAREETRAGEFDLPMVTAVVRAPRR